MLPVLAVGVDVLGRLGALGGQRSGLRHAEHHPPAPASAASARSGTGAHVGQRDPPVGTRDPDDGPVVGPPDELLVPPARARAGGAPASRSAARPAPGGLEEADEEVVRPPTDRAPAGPAITTEPPSATSAIGRSAAGSACASEPPIVPRCRICGSPTSEAACASSGASARTSSDPARSAWQVTAPITRSALVGPDAGQLGHPADVDQHRRHGQPQLHHRQQRVPAGEQLRVVAVPASSSTACSTDWAAA